MVSEEVEQIAILDAANVFRTEDGLTICWTSEQGSVNWLGGWGATGAVRGIAVVLCWWFVTRDYKGLFRKMGRWRVRVPWLGKLITCLISDEISVVLAIFTENGHGKSNFIRINAQACGVCAKAPVEVSRWQSGASYWEAIALPRQFRSWMDATFQFL